MKAHLPAILIGLITGLAAVCAAFVAGYWGAAATRDAVRAENDEAAGRLEADARGAARVLSSELFLAAREMLDFAFDGYFKPFDARYRIEVSPEDTRMIASRLQPEEWRYVNLAFSSVQGLERYVAVRSQPAHPLSDRPLSRHTLEIVKTYMEYVGRAIVALDELAGLEPRPFPVLDVETALLNIRTAVRVLRREAQDRG